MEKHPEPHIKQVIDGRITEAECSICGEHLPLGNEVGTAEEQDWKMRMAFRAHFKQKHQSAQDVNQIAARIVRTATRD
jgi:hypothetical protein